MTRLLLALVLCAPCAVSAVTPPQVITVDVDADGVLDRVEHDRGIVSIRDGRTGRQIRRAVPAHNVFVLGDADHDGLFELFTAEQPTVERDVPPPPPRRAFGAGPGSECLCADRGIIWDSADQLDNVWATALGDFDGDGLGEVLTVDWPAPTMRLYETVGDNALALTFETPPDAAPPGAFVTVTWGDSDNDGALEILGGETSTLNKVLLYEAVDDNQFEQRVINISEPDPTGVQSMGQVRIADTDQDGRQEIIFDTSSSVVGSTSELFIYEHSGIPGDHTYTKVYTYTTISYLFNWTVGDADNDGALDIVLGFGGVAGFPVTLRWLENTGDNTYEHKTIEPGHIGLALAPTVADVDGDGLNEVVFAGMVEDLTGGVMVYEAVGNDQFVTTYTRGGMTGNGISSAAAQAHCGARTVILAGSSDGEIMGVRHDGITYAPDGATPLVTGGQIRVLAPGDIDGDDRPDVAVASKGDDLAIVIEADAFNDGNNDGVLDSCEGCNITAECADHDGNDIRDDVCLWTGCVDNACANIAVTFGDVGGAFGDCQPDGVADGHDRYHVLNCFANSAPSGDGPYPCADDAPAAFNTDIGAAFGSCSPDGICDGHDVFHVLNAFGNVDMCTCPD